MRIEINRPLEGREDKGTGGGGQLDGLWGPQKLEGLRGLGCVYPQFSPGSVFNPRLFRALEALHPCAGLLPVGFADVTADLPRSHSQSASGDFGHLLGPGGT